MNKKIQLKINCYDREKKESFSIPFYINNTNSFIDVMKQIINKIEELNLEIKPENFWVIFGAGDNPREKYFVIEQPTNERGKSCLLKFEEFNIRELKN
jgi:hypothetical protein